MDIEQLLSHCGDFGRYQWMLMGLFCLINILASINYYSQTIITFVPEHWCYAPGLENKTADEIRAVYANYSHPHCTPLNNLSTTSVRSTAAFVDELGFRSLDTADASETGLRRTLVDFGTHMLYERAGGVSTRLPADGAPQCDRWIYNRDYGYNSMASDFNWVCQNAWQSTIGQSMFFVGSVIGSLVFGILADRIGRLPVLILANLMAMLGNGCTVFAVGPASFAAYRFVAGLATDSNFVMMYILVMEYIRPSMRTFGLNLCIGVFYCVGSMVTPWIAVALGDWRTYLVVTAVPVVLVPAFYLCVAESALWLIARNDVAAAIVCFERVARFNGRTIPPEVLEQFRKGCASEYRKLAASTVTEMTDSNGSCNEAAAAAAAASREVDVSGRSATLLGLFRTPRLRRMTLILFFKSMVITLCYDAISRNVDGMGVTPFVMFTFSAAAILPACVVLLLLQDSIGRKAMASLSLLVSGVFTAATGIIIAYQRGARDPYVLVTLACIGRFGATMAYNSANQYATELIPTCVRGQGVAAVHVAGYALTFFSSYILYLGNYWLALPSLILGCLSLAGAFLVLFLPETLNRTIPSTLAEGEEFGRGESVFDFACCDGRRGRGQKVAQDVDKVTVAEGGVLTWASQATIATTVEG